MEGIYFGGIDPAHDDHRVVGGKSKPVVHGTHECLKKGKADYLGALAVCHAHTFDDRPLALGIIEVNEMRVVRPTHDSMTR